MKNFRTPQRRRAIGVIYIFKSPCIGRVQGSRSVCWTVNSLRRGRRLAGLPCMHTNLVYDIYKIRLVTCRDGKNLPSTYVAGAEDLPGQSPRVVAAPPGAVADSPPRPPGRPPEAGTGARRRQRERWLHCLFPERPFLPRKSSTDQVN